MATAFVALNADVTSAFAFCTNSITKLCLALPFAHRFKKQSAANGVLSL